MIDLAVEAGVEVRIPAEEVEKHGLAERDGAVLGADPAGDTDLAVVLGGDGTILTTMRLFAGREVPVFAINYGAIGFLATVENADLDAGVRRALAGDFDVLRLPTLATTAEVGDQLAVNDISFHRRPGGRVAELAYSVRGEELGEVRCDGLVVSTPAGSTGYNLANGGPVLAWGVEGYVVSFIAPHTLTARALVVAPEDALQVVNRSAEGRAWRSPPTVTPPARSRRGSRWRSASSPARRCWPRCRGASFYHRMREKFGPASPTSAARVRCTSLRRARW